MFLPFQFDLTAAAEYGVLWGTPVDVKLVANSLGLPAGIATAGTGPVYLTSFVITSASASGQCIIGTVPLDDATGFTPQYYVYPTVAAGGGLARQWGTGTGLLLECTANRVPAIKLIVPGTVSLAGDMTFWVPTQ